MSDESARPDDLVIEAHGTVTPPPDESAEADDTPDKEQQ